jgi:hypothetical protein
MTAILSMDLDGGGFSAHLLHHCIDNIIAQYFSIDHFSVYPPLRLFLDRNSDSSLRVLGARSLNDLISSYSNYVLLDDLYKSASSVDHLLDRFQQLGDCLVVSGAHHIPELLRRDPYHKVFTRECIERAASVALPSLSLSESVRTYPMFRDYECMRKVISQGNSMGIHIRTFFDSPHGNQLFRQNYAHFTGWLLDQLSTECRNREHTSFFVAGDRKDIVHKFSLLIQDHLPDSQVFSSCWPVVHTSLSSAIDYRQDCLSIASQQAALDADSISYMLPSIYDWLLLGATDHILSTSSSFPATAHLMSNQQYITCYPCGDAPYAPYNRANIY